MTVSEFLTTIESDQSYVNHSLFLKSSDNYGCIYKLLIKSNDVAIRKEIFIELNAEESEITLLDKTVVSSIEVYPAK